MTTKVGKKEACLRIETRFEDIEDFHTITNTFRGWLKDQSTIEVIVHCWVITSKNTGYIFIKTKKEISNNLLAELLDNLACLHFHHIIVTKNPK